MGNSVLPPAVKPNIQPSSIKATAQSFSSSNGNADKKQTLPRGAPPPVPPNKPVVPPKKDTVIIRRDLAAASGVDPSKFSKDAKPLGITGSEPQEVVREDSNETYQNIPSSSQAGVV